MRNQVRRENGFTLIELLLVISIIGIMLSVSVPMSFSMYDNYKASPERPGSHDLCLASATGVLSLQ